MAAKSRFAPLVIGAALLGLGFSFPASEPDKTADLANQIKGYKHWHKVNKQPVHMAPRIAALCAAPPTWSSSNNPHDPRWFTVFVSRPGEETMAKGGDHKFPEGTTIVKEKLHAIKDKKPELLTVMVKRAEGFDPKNGDWEFFISDGKGRISQDNIAVCQSCHQQVASNDYVFRGY